MADLDLNDALHESTPNVEPEIKRDFIASLEAEKYDDVVGESMTKESYVPLLDDETKSPSSEAKDNVMVHLHEETAPEQSDGGQLAERPGATEQESAELPNGEHGVGKTDGMEIHKRPLGIDPLSFGFDYYVEGATMETISPSAQMGTEPPFSTPGILERPDTKELFNLETVLPPEHEMKGTTMSCPTLQHLNSLVKVTEELSSEEKRTSECSLVSSEEMAHPREQMLDSTWQATDSMATVTAPLAFEEDLWVNQEEVTNSSTTLSPAEQELSTELSGNLAEVNLWEKETFITDLPTKPAQQHMEPTQEVTEEFGVPFLSLHQAESSFHLVDCCDPDLSSARLMDDCSPVSNIAKTTAAVDTVLQTPTKYSPTTPQQENLSCEARLPPSTEPFSPACGNFDSSVGAVDLTNNTTEIAVLPTKTPLLDRTSGKVKLAEATSEIAQNIESPVVKVAVEKKKKKKKRSHTKGAQPPAMDMHAKAKEVQAIVSDQRLEGPPGGTGKHKENVLNSEGSSKEASGLQVKTQVAGGVPSQSSIWASESSESELAHQPLHNAKAPSESDVRAVVENQRSEAARAANQSQMERMSEVEWTQNTSDCWSREVTASEFLQASKMEEKVEHPLELWGENIISPNSQKKTEVSRVAPLTPLKLDGREYTPPQSEEVPEMKVKEGPYLAHISKEPTSPGSKQMFEVNEMTVHEDSQITVFRSQLPFEVKEVAETLLESESGENNSPKFQQTFEVKEKTETLTENADREPSLLESLKVPEGKQIESSPEHVAGLTPSHQSGEMSGVNKMAEAPLNFVDTEATSPESNKISEVKKMTPIPLNHESRETSSLGLKQTLEVKEMAETSLAQVSTETAPPDLDISEVKGVVDISLENCDSKIAPVEEQKSEGEILVENTLCWNRETAPSELQQMLEVNEVVEEPLECWDREISHPDSQTFNVKELVASPPESPNKETGSPQLQQTSEMKEMLESPLEHPNKETDLSETQQASEVNEMVKSPMEYQEGFPKCTDQVTSSSPKHETPKLLDDNEEKGSKVASKKEAGPKVLQKRGFPKGTLQRETGAKVSSDQHRATKTSMQPKVMKVPSQRQRDVKQLGSEKIGEINVQSDQEGHLDESSRQDEAKPEESSAEGMVGTESAVTSKERPLSTDAKGKTGTPAAKISPTKSKPQPPASLKRPPATTTSPNKKLVTSTSATTAASTSKRVSSSLVRPSSATTKEMKPKATEAKSPVKLPSTRPSSASVTKTASNTTVKSSTTSLQKMSTAPGSTQRNNMLSNPKRPTSIKTEPKSAEMKKSLSAKSPLGETGRPKTASSTSIKSTGTTPSTPSTPMGASTPATPSSNTSRPPRTLALKTTAASEAKRVAPIPRAPSKPTVAAAPKQLRPTSAPAPDLKNVKSKIGSTDNIKHQPGGGKAKPVEKRPEPVRLSRKAESSTVTRVTKTTTMKDSQKQTNGKVQIVNKKIDYSHVQSKCGSKDNIKHVPGGGNVQIPKTKLDVSRASSKCGSKTNLKHKAGGGDVKIETAKTDFKNKAESKIGSLDNLNHIPGGGNVKNEGEEESESATISQIPENGDLTGQAESVTQQNGVGEDPTARSAETHSQELQIQETY
ncbi:microtubule-associated protein 4-like isoform X2 [Chiloscyllium plagiosum]|uniref:microtubule-associated protein 4-like isoform X2 n=1 Tax=Chiloscyllium plagiosum TaxID=36176 RepID=UPI001CB83EA4|nr:microtubule-associated protein 4-like isoform X2 [Chiloscyllium plagiosum]